MIKAHFGKNKLKPFLNADIIEAGCDEAGRGCLAGPVFASAVIFPKGYENTELNDSKLLSEKKRYELRGIIEHEALGYAIAIVDNNEIDKINILNASFLAMHKAIQNLNIIPEHIIIDGNRFKPYKQIPYTCVVKGDSKFLSIAAASILAKTYRDDFMIRLDQDFPYYDWKTNKGYATKRHKEAILKYGLTSYHRRTFMSWYNQLTLPF